MIWGEFEVSAGVHGRIVRGTLAQCDQTTDEYRPDAVHLNVGDGAGLHLSLAGARSLGHALQALADLAALGESEQ